jgi:hypothetical protein
VAGADWHRRGGERTEVEEEAFLLLFSFYEGYGGLG